MRGRVDRREAILFFGTRGAVPAKDDGNTSILVRLPPYRLLIDASGNPFQQLLRGGLGLEDLDGVVLTHGHPDHLYGFPSLVHALTTAGRRAPLRVIGEEETRRRARGLLETLGLDPDRPGFELRYAEGWREAGLEVELLPGVHSVPSRMVRLRGASSPLLYTSDTAPGPAVREAARGCRVLVHEASGPHALLAELQSHGHSSAFQAGEDAREAAVERLFLCHFGPGPAHDPRRMKAEAARAYRGRIVVPRPWRWYAL